MEKIDHIGALLVKAARLCRVYKIAPEGKTFKKLNLSLIKFRSSKKGLGRLDEVLRCIISELNRAKDSSARIIAKGELAGIIDFLTSMWNFTLDLNNKFRKFDKFRAVLKIMISEYFRELAQ